MDERLKRQLAFALEIDKEKNILRQTHLSGHGRRENDAEHAWHMALMSYLLREYANEEVDIARVMLMCLIHDIVEIDAGDTYAYDESRIATQKEREDAAKERIFSILPDDQKRELTELFDEFEAYESAASKFAHSMDNLQPLLLNNSNGGADWREHGVTAAQVYGRQGRTREGSKRLFEVTDQIIKNHIALGNIRRDKGPESASGQGCCDVASAEPAGPAATQGCHGEPADAAQGCSAEPETAGQGSLAAAYAEPAQQSRRVAASAEPEAPATQGCPGEPAGADAAQGRTAGPETCHVKAARMEELYETVARLRAPDGCPWDRAQTHVSLKAACIEEAAEVISGINILSETGKPRSLCEELGDLLLQVVMHAQIAEEEGLFTLDDVIRSINEKMIRRHPHVFGCSAKPGEAAVPEPAQQEKGQDKEQHKRQDKEQHKGQDKEQDKGQNKGQDKGQDMDQHKGQEGPEDATDGSIRDIRDDHERIHAGWKAVKALEKKGREWEEPYLFEAFTEAEKLIDVARKRKKKD